MEICWQSPIAPALLSEYFTICMAEWGIFILYGETCGFYGFF
ncbi:hypothetical protein KIS1582_3615 [Cytobacillus firmus]|uniref:Uncharacterized protein n=1 Tax=Cytobacillus firmus TaxID=1399 RepID=A0A800MU94_CYTFI|nr:hypothetical protein KIS1582_3615 [Cytobacillus firmus]